MNRRPLLIVSAVVVVAMLAISAWAWGQVADDAQIPIHWGIDGQPNGYAPKAIGLFILPGVTALIAIVYTLIPRFEPRRANLERSAKAYAATWTAVMILLLGIHVLTTAVVVGAAVDVARFMLLGVGALFIVIGNYLPKIRPNYLMGIRTPWTLASDLSWVKTHRLGGRLLVLGGILLIALGIVGASSMVVVAAVIGIALVALVAMVAYSYRIWKIDPQKRGA